MILILILLTQSVWAQDLPSQDALNSDQVLSNVQNKERSQHIPHERVLSDLGKIPPKKKEKPELMDLEQNIAKAKELFQKIYKTKKENIDIKDKISTKVAAPTRRVKKEKKIIPTVTITSGIFVNQSPVITHDFYNSITLPSGSTALATLIAGVEVSSEIKQVNARLDYAFLGPNKAIVELKDCHIWLDVSGNYNTERIYGEGKSLSCKTPSGATFDVKLQAQLRDHQDEYIGKKATLVTRGKVAAAAMQFLQTGVSEFGKAMAAAQVTSEVIPGGPNSDSQSASNVTGSDAKYIGGQAIAGASAGFLDWWINYYKSLSPTLAMAPGSKVFLTIKGEVQIPKEFFKEATGTSKTFLRNNTNTTLSTTGFEDEVN